jgi:hypothetical protein
MGQRRISALRSFVAPLTLDVPPPAAQLNMLDKLSAKQVAKQITNESSKAHKKQQKLAPTISRSAADAFEDGSSTASSSNEVDLKIQNINMRADNEIASAEAKDRAKIEEKRWKDIAKAERERGKSSRKEKKSSSKGNRRSSKADKKVREDEEKQAKDVAKLEYIVIENI